MFRCFVLSILIFTQSVQAYDISLFNDLVVDHIIEEYSKGWDDDQFLMSKSDVWGLELAPNDPKYCVVTVTGFAEKPTYRGSAIYKFWVCVTEPKPNQYEVEIFDQEMISEAD